MKALWFLPFTFASGAEGFALFAPYLILILSLLHLVQYIRQHTRPLASLRVASSSALEPRPVAWSAS